MDKYRPGDFYVKCDHTGFKIRRSEARMTWDNLLVRRDTWEPRHPQEFVRSVREDTTVEQPRGGWETDTYLTTNEVTEDDL